MKKLKQLKQAMKNTPPERLARIEYKSHFYQILGVLFVCSILIYRGYWYIIFAFIFSLGISYSQGITAYQKYRTIMQYRLKPGYELDFMKDKSPSRKRDNVIRSVIGWGGWWACIVASIAVAYLLIGFATWYQKLAFAMFILFFQIILYFFLLYWIAFPFYKYKQRKLRRK